MPGRLQRHFLYESGLSGLGDCSDPGIRQKIADYAARYGIDPNIALRQIQQESGCRATVCSPKAACGIAQFIPSTWAQYGSGDRSNVDTSLDAWGRFMRDLLSMFGGNYRLALAGYHSGPGAARAALANPRGNPNTNNYVNSIMGGAAAPGPASPGAAQGVPPIMASGVIDRLRPYSTYIFIGIAALVLVRR